MIKLSDCSESVSHKELQSILSQVPFTLPESFLKLYESYNGGIPDKTEVRGGRNIFPVHQFYDWSDILFFKSDLDSYSVPSSLDSNKVLPFACDQGGNVYSLYFDKQLPRVIFYTTSDEMLVWGEWDTFSCFLECFQ
ncbi:SMI1/KNR4 family protein [Microbulbifer sp. TRSA007]|uniref:SMI1/KNR4 family protein n=1 Tax=Microbulbifer sp. TRSA007 TaxID=3243384 RepID=UPI00403A550A